MGIVRCEQFYKPTVLQMIYRKIIISSLFCYNSFLKLCSEIYGRHNLTVLMRCVINGLHCTSLVDFAFNSYIALNETTVLARVKSLCTLLFHLFYHFFENNVDLDQLACD